MGRYVGRCSGGFIVGDWWNQETEPSVAGTSAWPQVVRAVAEHSPPPAVRACAISLASAVKIAETGDEAPGQALLFLAKCPRMAELSAETAVAVLEALELSTGPSPTGQLFRSAANDLLRAASARESADARLVLLAARVLLQDRRGNGADNNVDMIVTLAKKSRNVDIESATRLFLLVREEAIESKEASAQELALLEVLLAALAPDEAAAPLLEAFLVSAIASGGASEFRRASDQALVAATRLATTSTGSGPGRPERPRPFLRREAMATVLSSELRLGPIAEGAQVARLRTHFEDLLAALPDDEPEKIDWWVRYVEFAEEAGRCNLGKDVAPAAADIHWRALRSVPDQATYSERVHRVLRAGVS